MFVAARKTEIIRVTELILDAINSGDFETYTYVLFLDTFRTQTTHTIIINKQMF